MQETDAPCRYLEKLIKLVYPPFSVDSKRRVADLVSQVEKLGKMERLLLYMELPMHTAAASAGGGAGSGGGAMAGDAAVAAVGVGGALGAAGAGAAAGGASSSDPLKQ